LIYIADHDCIDAEVLLCHQVVHFEDKKMAYLDEWLSIMQLFLDLEMLVPWEQH
jgi:hypothetical protein